MINPKPNKILAVAEATRLWKLYDFKTPNELVLEDLAMALGIVVIDDALDSAAARLVRNGGTGIIRISTALSETNRRRFALAHEIGHWQLHSSKSPLLACTEDDMLKQYGASPLEVEASAFAGALLMPKKLFLERVRERRPTRAVITELCEYFGTSLTATALRFVETSHDYYVFVLSEANRIRWWKASDAFGEHNLWIDSRTLLHNGSIAASFFRGDIVPVEPRHIDVCQWFDDLPHIHSNTVVEQAFPLKSYNQVISMLWLP